MNSDDNVSPPVTHMYEGVPYPPVISTDSIEQMKEMQFYDEDVIVVTFPKSGTHWILNLVRLIDENSFNGPKLTENTIEEYSSSILKNHLFLEIHMPGHISMLDMVKQIEEPRLLGTHLRPQYLKKPLETRKTKFVILTRNEKDVLVSAYNFFKKAEFANFHGEWNDFYKFYKNNKIGHGCWIDWNLAWYAYKDYENVLFLKYEDLKDDPSAEVQRIANFLNMRIYSPEDICEKASFNNMKKEESFFLRKGVTGEWKKYFSKEQNREIDERYEEKVVPTGLKMRFEL